MPRHNNVVANQHFHKDWQNRVKTWFQQPVQKKIRREKRKVKAAKLAPRPAAGALRPLVHCPTQKYNMKVRQGRGFTLEELKEAGINAKLAQTIGIAVDHRRTNKSVESLNLNVQRLKEYSSRLVVFPRRASRTKKGDASADDVKAATQLVGDIIATPATESPVTFAAVTEDMKAFKAYSSQRIARNEHKLIGRRIAKVNAAAKS
mmetsp:Transcript_40691/g.53380  ORF Transcript_40691/g.53380 Transcript_40691/m.53380 type:complete len:205 (+) Transcript_40691:34-648(+)